MLTERRVTASVFNDFLKLLLVNASAPVFLVVDGDPARRSKTVKRFVQERNGRLEWHCLPAYSPELNPDELVWNNLKTHELGCQVMTSGEELRTMIHSYSSLDVETAGVDHELFPNAYNAICLPGTTTLLASLMCCLWIRENPSWRGAES